VSKHYGIRRGGKGKGRWRDRERIDRQDILRERDKKEN
jgi:hypothetical protein